MVLLHLGDHYFVYILKIVGNGILNINIMKGFHMVILLFFFSHNCSQQLEQFFLFQLKTDRLIVIHTNVKCG